MVIIRFRVVRHTRADRGNFTLRVTELRPRDSVFSPCVFSPCVFYPFSQETIRYQLSTNLSRAVIRRHVVSPASSIHCRSRVDLALCVPCAASITVPLENRYRPDLTITYRDHHSTLLGFVKTKFQGIPVYFGEFVREREPSGRRCAATVNWLLRGEPL